MRRIRGRTTISRRITIKGGMVMSTTMLPIFDYRGQPMKLQTKRTYRLRVKNGYILALLPQQHQVKLPNLLNVQKAS